MWEETLTTVVHAVESGDVYSTEVQPLANDFIKIRYGGGDCGDTFVLVEGQWSVVHDGLIIIRCVQISDKVVLILIEIVLLPCEERITLSLICGLSSDSMSFKQCNHTTDVEATFAVKVR